jgi:hypothetical protein
LREPKRSEQGQAVNDLLLDQPKQLLGRKKLMIQYHGNVDLLCHPVMANKHGNRVRFSVLLKEDCAACLIKKANSQNIKPSSLIRDLVYKRFGNAVNRAKLVSEAKAFLKELEDD